MSLEIKNLRKTYGNQQAVDDLTFEASQGEILGFLGPNGAGKSTTMKIITGFLSATSGSVWIDGYDVETNTIESQKKIGYLPEHNPLYLDLYVREFLAFSGALNGISKKTKSARIDEVIDMCGLSKERHKKLGQLSKGYRQRAGLAQALLHDPDILILDEPTSGLDPNQILEIRNLIKEVSKNKTVVLSTHIMQEVEALCDRVVLINNGKKIADQTIAEFAKGFKEELVLRVELKESIDAQILLEIDSVQEVKEVSKREFQITVSNSEKARAEIFRLASESNLPLLSLQEEKGSLEEVFKSLTNGD